MYTLRALLHLHHVHYVHCCISNTIDVHYVHLVLPSPLCSLWYKSVFILHIHTLPHRTSPTKGGETVFPNADTKTTGPEWSECAQRGLAVKTVGLFRESELQACSDGLTGKMMGLLMECGLASVFNELRAKQ
jgi:hypothetical protein